MTKKTTTKTRKKTATKKATKKTAKVSASVKHEVDELSLLYDISQSLEMSLDLNEVAMPILSTIAEYMKMQNVYLTLLNRHTGEISTEAAYGLTSKEIDKGRYQSGEGITGTVVKTGKPEIIAKVKNDQRFLDKTGAKKRHDKDISFLCVPIKIGRETVGTLGAICNFTGKRNLDSNARRFTIICSMISQAVRLRQKIEEERQRLTQENERLQHELQERFRPGNIIGKSQAMQSLYDLMAQVKESGATVLIRGESGTGKELVAHAIHHNSPRSGKPYVKVNCAALSESMLESELFGHEKGAFTGALDRKIGRFELAKNGTIFLDEVGDFSPSTQVKLLRVLQEREFERVGGTETIKVNIRVVAATNRNLEELVAQGEFREDLYYRLNVFPLHLPPLRERKSDILLLVNHFIAKYGATSYKDVRRISTPAIDMIMAYHWPGNVRELENCIERAVLLTNDQVIHGHHLPPTLQTAENTNTSFKGTLDIELNRVEREMICESLKTARGNCVKAAQNLGISERIMGLRLLKYNIDYKRFRGTSIKSE